MAVAHSFPTGAFYRVSQTRVGITPSPTRALSPIPCALLAFSGRPIHRAPWSPFITCVVGLNPRASLTVRSFITFTGGGVVGISSAKM